MTKFAAEKNFEQLEDEKEKWCYAIRNMSRLREGDIPESDNVFHTLYEDCKIEKLTDMEKEEYKKSILEYEDVQEAIKYNSMLSKEEGFNDGYEKGREEGANETKMQIIASMLENNIPIPVIAKVTGASDKEIEMLR